MGSFMSCQAAEASPSSIVAMMAEVIIASIEVDIESELVQA